MVQQCASFASGTRRRSLFFIIRMQISIAMDRNNLKFKTVSLNVPGIRTFEKRKSIFNWLIKQNSDICFLQETYSTDLKAVLNSLNISVDLEIKDVLFGILDTSNINILVNYIVLESKYFIYRCKLNKGSLRSSFPAHS